MTRAFVALAVGLAAAAWAAGPQVVGLRVEPTRAAACGRVTVSFELSRSYKNPYDPAEVAVDCHLRGPGGRRMTVPCFWYVPYRPADEFTARHIFTNPGREAYRRAGPGRWQARLTLPAPGPWRGRITVRDADGQAASAEFTITCTHGSSLGYLHPAPNGRFLQFDDGTGFIPVGMCIAWARGNGPRDCYDYYVPRLARAGGNTVRVWMCHWAWLEWTPGDTGALRGYSGAGRYNQQVAFNFDRLLDLAERAGIYLQICLNNACWEFGRPDGRHDAYDSWGGNPYNVKNGGPCRTPAEFWTNPEARRLYRNKLRYIVARWGWSTHVLAWELWNEVGAETPATAAWHREMAEYLRRVDPWHHPVTTSSWCSDPADNLSTFAAMDLVQLHYAGPEAIAAARRLWPDKPVIVGEGPWQPDAMLRAGWLAPFAGAAGPPLTWHTGPSGDVEKHDLYRYTAAFAAFWRDFPAAANSLATPKASVRVEARDAGQLYAPVVIRPGFNTWLKRSSQSRFVVPPDGRVDTAGMSSRLYGSNPDRRPYRNPPTFVVDYPEDGEFAVRIGECSGPATLVIEIDGRQALRFNVPGSGRRHPPAEAQWQRVAVPRGPHEIRVDNAGADWMSVGPFVLTNYRDVRRWPPVRAQAIVASGHGRLLVVNEWAEAAAAAGLAPPPELDISATWQGFGDGKWEITWVDPATGRPVRRELVAASAGALTTRCRLGRLAVARCRHVPSD